jgi:gliding motility-associated-like protein
MGQAIIPYRLNGSAYQENCNCYTITPDNNNSSGSLWNVNKIDLTQSFDYKFNVFLGCADVSGADGIVFVLQPIDISIGTTGQGLGFQGVQPSIGIAIDTYQNSEDSDPVYDHISINRDGDIKHVSSNNLAGPVTAIQNRDNIEDCSWHTFRIIWDAGTKLLKAQIDGVDRVQVTLDLVGQVFKGDPKVFWGFTGSTGGSRNHQRVCTALNPGFKLPAGLSTCYTEPVSFQDTSSSFGSIVRWAWDFGDGSTFAGQNPAPHLYPVPGNYEVKLNIEGNDGCVSDTFRYKLLVGSKPVAGFFHTPDPICDSMPVGFNDTSKVEYGTISQWNWLIDGQTYTTQNAGPVPIKATGAPQVTLKVKTKEGCESDIASETLTILPRPVLNISYSDVCKGESVFFNATNSNALVGVQQWNWNFGNGNTDQSGPTVTQLYPRAGRFPFELFATGDNGCRSATLSSVVNVYETNAFAGNDTIVADNQPVQLRGTGGIIYSWSPSAGLSNPDIANPVATLTNDMEYVLTASTPQGCTSTDTLNIKVFKGPAIYVPSAFTPNGDGRNDQFRIIAIGMKEVNYFRIYNRYGQMIFSTSQASQGWDGSFNGKPAPSGTYVWMARGVDYTGQVHAKKGTITLIR